MIHVVAGVLCDADDRVLIAQRPPGRHLAGGWEFPGGKLEPGESPRDGLKRELEEELGIIIGPARPLLRLLHRYPYGEVLLDVWVIRRYSGEPRGLDGQALRWCRHNELEAASLLPADGPVVAALCLPEVLTHDRGEGYAIVGGSSPIDPSQAGVGALREGVLRGVLCDTVEAAEAGAEAGASFLVLAVELPDRVVSGLCAAVSVPVFVRGTSLEKAWWLGASGLNGI